MRGSGVLSFVKSRARADSDVSTEASNDELLASDANAKPPSRTNSPPPNSLGPGGNASPPAGPRLSFLSRSRSSSLSSPSLPRRSYSWRDSKANVEEAAAGSAILIPKSVPAGRAANFAAILVAEMGQPNSFTFFQVLVKRKSGDGSMCLAVTPEGIAGLPTRNSAELSFFHGWSFVRCFLTPKHRTDCAGYTLPYNGKEYEWFFKFENATEQQVFLARVRTLSLAATAMQSAGQQRQSRTDEERAIEVDSNASYDGGPIDGQELDL